MSVERRPDLQEELGVVAVAVGHTFDDLDLVVDALAQVGSQRPAAVGQDAGQVGLKPAHEHPQRLQAAAQGSSLPSSPGLSGPGLAAVVLQLLQVFLEQVHGQQGLVGRQQLVQADRLIGRYVLAVAQQQPARSLDHAPRRFVVSQAIGFAIPEAAFVSFLRTL